MRRGRPRPSTAGANGGMLFILAFHALAHYAGQEHKPPVTAILIILNVLLFFRPGRLDDVLPSISEVCLNPHLVLKGWDLKRWLLSAFYHSDETHLVYNMLSLLWKGVQLEGSMGSLKFAEMVAVLLGLSHGLVVVLAKGLDVLADCPDTFYSHCAIGFSAVLFALKVVLNWNSPTHTIVYGVPVPSRYAAWAELILVQMFVPGTSFIGHLSGILAGVIYVKFSQWLTASRLFPGFFRRLSILKYQLLLPFRSLFRPLSGRGRTLGGRSRVGTNNDGHDTANQSTVWRCPRCEYDNPIYLDWCEMCDASMPGIGASSSAPSAPPLPSSPSSSNPSTEEMRRARLARFSR